MTRFIKISMESLPTLAKILETRLPKSARLFNVLQFHLQNRISSASFYSSEQVDQFEDKTGSLFLFCQQNRTNETNDTLITICEPDEASLLTDEIALAFVSFIDWSVDNQVGAMSPTLYYKVFQTCKTLGLKLKAFPCKTFVMTFPKALALDINIREPGIEVCELSRIYVPKIVSLWKFSSESNSVHAMMCDSIENIGGSAGVYVSANDSVSKKVLVSWMLVIPSGNMFALQTDPQFQGRGYGELVLKAACKFGAKKSYVPIVHVETYNKKALKLAEKVGFEHTWDIYFVDFKSV